MSRPEIHSFPVTVTYDDDSGDIKSLHYGPCEGCGHEAQDEMTVSFDRDEDGRLVDLAEYHVDHLWRSHKMKIPKRCTAVWSSSANGAVRCSLTDEQHADYGSDHVFKWRDE